MNEEHQLLDEALEPSEVRELLERLGEEESGGPDAARVRDVVEATGAPAAVIGKMLADIRKDAWEQKFGLRQKEVERKVEHHEKRLNQHELQLRDKSLRVLNVEDSTGKNFRARRELADLGDEEIYDAVKREERRRNREALLWVIPMMIIVMIIASGGCPGGANQRETTHPPRPTIHRVR